MFCRNPLCIFVHIPKTAGQSVERYFLDLLGASENQLKELLLCGNRDPSRGPPRLSHLRAAEYVSGGFVSEQEFRDAFKFSFVRNPWDRIVSFYKYRGHAYRYDFKTFLFHHFPVADWSNDYCHVMPQHAYLYQGKDCLVDFVGRFENLQSDFDHVCRIIGTPTGRLPHVNQSLQQHTVLSVLRGEPRKIARNLKRIARRGRMKRNTFGHYSEYYDDESREYVQQLYHEDINCFGYVFENKG
jgi:hypothetical protein